LVLASRTHVAARATNLAIGAVYVLLAVLGPVINDTAADIIGLNGADHFLHLASGALLVAGALVGDRQRTATA
jgi:hypothetical protein